MIKLFLLALSVILFNSSVALSNTVNLPKYIDDDEFYHCANMTHDWSPCADEEQKRLLRDVKILYQNVLSDEKAREWNGSQDENKMILRDMYESWSAFKNRLCSINKIAEKNLPTMTEPFTGCNLYVTFHHKNQMNTALYMLNANAPRNPYPRFIPSMDGEFDFTILLDSEHDEFYTECLKNKNRNPRICLAEEQQRADKELMKYYEILSKKPELENWNNGPDLNNGNFKDMHDSWVAYRNRLCSLITFAKTKGYGEKAADNDLCILSLTKEFVTNLDGLALATGSYLDEAVVGETTEKEDGGEAEGKKIKPLRRRISAKLNGDESENQATTEVEASKAEEVSAPAEQDARGRKIPSWAQKY